MCDSGERLRRPLSLAELAGRAQVLVASMKCCEDTGRSAPRPKIRQAILAALTQLGIAFDRKVYGSLSVSLKIRPDTNSLQ